ncbi:MAG: peptidylprolyl isomerase, partial [Patescibacteria group bacterium]
KYSGATLNTNLGKITLKFFPESAPKTVNNFLKLASVGFYDGTKFHRVIRDFMIQGGDPNSRDDSKKNLWGTGGPGYKFPDELSGQEKYDQGTLAMANSGPNTNGSQFFIVTADPGYPLPPSYTVFGEVSEGLETALKIQEVSTDSSDRPLQDVMIERVTLIEKK